jgi:hypothetical protein
MRRPIGTFLVRVGSHVLSIQARTAGAAARRAFRRLIGPKGSGRPLCCQPVSTPEGGWEDTSIWAVEDQPTVRAAA